MDRLKRQSENIINTAIFWQATIGVLACARPEDLRL
jgi:hypothetical protein